MNSSPETHIDVALDAKRRELLRLLADAGRVAVAFSGGVDSAVVAKAAHLACGENAVAVTAVSPSLATGELEEATQLAAQIGIRHLAIRTAENENPDYRRNAPDRCYFCKTELYARLEDRLEELQADVVVNGANMDDRGDHRPGMQAANEHAVRSPLMEAGLTKREVRELARSWGLPVWDKPATPCLSSRIAYGVEVTEDRLARVDGAEQFLKQEFGLREFRVRHEANDLARIEVPAEELPRVLEPDARRAIVGRLHTLGFRYVTIDLDGFRSGSLNEGLAVHQISRLA